MQKIKNLDFSNERALYNIKNTYILDCKFQGEEDGESALKECCNLKIEKTYFDLRYPLWHDDNIELNDIEMTTNCRAALWYDTNVKINNSMLHGIKALRECRNIKIMSSSVISPEFGWKCNNLDISDCNIESEYAFLESAKIVLDKVTFQGKYSFQYTKNLKIKNSILNTKDAFWHSKNVTVYDSVIRGEYLGWYSKNLTLVHCHIKGTQPFCYCKNLKLIDCTMEDADFAFEYSSVNASINSEVLSIKNPLSGKIIVNSCKDIILQDSIYPNKAKITRKNKRK